MLDKLLPTNVHSKSTQYYRQLYKKNSVFGSLLFAFLAS